MSRIKDTHRGSKEYSLVYAEPINAATHRGMVTYQELAKLIGLPLVGNYMGTVLGKLLGEISEDEMGNGRPLLSAIAVAAGGRPGAGFYDWAARLGRFDGKDEKAVYDTWRVVLPK